MALLFTAGIVAGFVLWYADDKAYFKSKAELEKLREEKEKRIRERKLTNRRTAASVTC